MFIGLNFYFSNFDEKATLEATLVWTKICMRLESLKFTLRRVYQSDDLFERKALQNTCFSCESMKSAEMWHVTTFFWLHKMSLDRTSTLMFINKLQTTLWNWMKNYQKPRKQHKCMSNGLIQTVLCNWMTYCQHQWKIAKCCLKIENLKKSRKTQKK